MAKLLKFLQGIGLGFALILPGMSGGTAFIIFGFYHRIIADLARFRLRPYILLFIVAAIGVVGGAEAIGFLLSKVPNLLVSFLLGALLASVRLVLPRNPRLTPGRFLVLALGLLVAFFFTSEPLGTIEPVIEKAWPLYFAGGVFSSATMLLPGVSGSTVLIIMGLYDDAITALNNLQLLKLFIFACGWGIGLFGFARLLNSFHRQHSQAFSFLLTGLIIGSGRSLLPAYFSWGALGAFLAGAILVLYFGGKD